MRHARLLLLFLCLLLLISHLSAMSTVARHAMRERVRSMFIHAYDSYMTFAFPHDELKPLSQSWTDSLSELGNAQPQAKSTYSGVALTLIDSLSTLVIMGNQTEFHRAVAYISKQISFDVDVRVNVFEVNIRLLGGLLSAHILATDPVSGMSGPGLVYNGELLSVATQLGDLLLPAFDTPTGIPYAWVNLRHGVSQSETKEQCTAGVGTLLLEFGFLSYLTGDTRFYDAAERSVVALYQMRSSIGLLGNTFDITTRNWINPNSGIGGGVDSYYEYLFKAYILFGDSQYYDMFNTTYSAVIRYLKHGPWYIESDMNTAIPSHLQFQSLHAFWPGLQTLTGDLLQAKETYNTFYLLWQKYDALPERFILNTQSVHSSERYYPLRPELMESTYFLYRSTNDQSYQAAGEYLYFSLYNFTRVSGGYASVSNVENKQLDDHMNSFFLAETCKYLFLLFDEENWLHQYQTLTRKNNINNNNKKRKMNTINTATTDVDSSDEHQIIDYIFTTEGHLFPLTKGLHRMFGDESARVKKRGRMRLATKRLMRTVQCPTNQIIKTTDSPQWTRALMEYYAAVAFKHAVDQQMCDLTPPASGSPPTQPIPVLPFMPPLPAMPMFVQQAMVQGDFHVRVATGAFIVERRSTNERVEIRNLGTTVVEVVDQLNGHIASRVVTNSGVYRYKLACVEGCDGDNVVIEATGAFFGPSAPDGMRVQVDDKNIEEVEVILSATLDEDGTINIDLGDDDGTVSVASDHRVLGFPLSGPMTRSPERSGCHPPTESFDGAVVFIDRGDCSFVEKAVIAQNAGADAAVIVNGLGRGNEKSLFLMGFDTTEQEVFIPVIMVMSEDVTPFIKANEAGRNVTVRLLRYEAFDGDEYTPPRRAMAGVRPSRAETIVISDDTIDIDGSMKSFVLRTLGGWRIEVEERDNKQFTMKVME